MEISVTGKHIKLGDFLEEHVYEKLTYSIKKLLGDVIRADVVFDKEHSQFTASISVKEAHNIVVIRSNDSSNDAYHAFDKALIKLEKQLRKHKDRIKDHHKLKLSEVGMDLLADIPAKKYILDSLNHEEKEGEIYPVIIAEKATNIETLTVAGAVMKMDLAHLPAILFKNKINNRLNIVYYRADGNISWIDPVC